MIKKIQFFGERNSGTNYLQQLIQRNLCPATQEFGWKHWLPNKEKRQERLMATDTLFLVIFRDPHDWVRSMHKEPHHAHFSLRNISFSQFIRKEWITVGPDGQEFMRDRYNCGRRFENLLKMRSYKIAHFLKMSAEVSNFYCIQYEELKKYTGDVIRKISKRFEIPLLIDPPENVTGQVRNGKVLKHQHRNTVYPSISDEELRFIDSELDWKLEEVIGYSRKYRANI